MSQTELAKPPFVLVDLAASPDGLEEGAAHDDPFVAQYLELASEIGRDIGGSPPELDHVDVVAGRLENVLPGARPEALVEDVRQAAFARRKVKVRQGWSPGALLPLR